MPVGTQASLKGLTPEQLEDTGCRLCLNNTYHLWVTGETWGNFQLIMGMPVASSLGRQHLMLLEGPTGYSHGLTIF